MYKTLANTLFMGKNLLAVPRCDSTNTLAASLTKGVDFLEGTVIITDHQYKGHGQRGNKWLTEPGKNLTFSILLKPVFLSIKKQFLLNEAISLGIYSCLQHLINKPVSIKWPNDILVEYAKVCGILLENQLQGNCFTKSIVGVGLNVNQKYFPGLAASSLYNVSGKAFSLADSLALLLEHIEPYYIMLRQGRYKAIEKAYTSALFGMGKKHVFEVGNKRIEGILRGVNTTGCLIVETGHTTRAFNAKEIRFCDIGKRDSCQFVTGRRM